MDQTQFPETWDIHNRINLYLLNAVEQSTLLFAKKSKHHHDVVLSDHDILRLQIAGEM